MYNNCNHLEKIKTPTKMEVEYWYMKLRAKNFYSKYRNKKLKQK